MHLDVCFRVCNIESDSWLLSTNPSDSPWLLLKNGFGIDVSSSLHELNVSESILKLSGYISGPFGAANAKACQYVYINSRFICKGPIHKLLNQLAARISCTEPWNISTASQSRKRSRSQAYPTYILNIICPRSCYDLIFEPSKTSVEFKDWSSVLHFVEHSVIHLWSDVSFGDIIVKGDIRKETKNIVSNGDFSEGCKLVEKKQRDQSSFLQPLLSSSGMTSKNGNYTREEGTLFQNSFENDMKFRESESSESEHVSKTDHSSDGSFVQINSRNNDCLTFEPEAFSLEACLSRNTCLPKERSADYMVNRIGSTWDDMQLGARAKVSNGLSSGTISPNSSGMNGDPKKLGENITWPVQRCCSSSRSLQPDRQIFINDGESEFQIDIIPTECKLLSQNAKLSMGNISRGNLSIEPKTIWQDEGATSSFSTRIRTNVDTDCLLRDSVKLHSTARRKLTEDNLLPDVGAKSHKDTSTNDTKWSALIDDICSEANIEDIQQFINNNVLETRFNYNGNYRYDYLTKNKDEAFRLGTMLNSSYQDCCLFSGHQKISVADSKEDYFKFEEYKLDGTYFTDYTGFFSSTKDWFGLDSFGIPHNDFTTLPFCRDLSSNFADENNNNRFQRTRDITYNCKKLFQRSHSAPPFFKRKRKFFTLSDCSTIEDKNSNSEIISNVSASRGNRKLRHVDFPSNSVSLEDFVFHSRPDMNVEAGRMGIENCCDIDNSDSITVGESDFSSEEAQYAKFDSLKWRNSCVQITSKRGEKLHNLQNHDPVLDIFSGILHLSGDSLVKKFLNKKCLANAKVLHQVDKKFIPIVANGILAIIDQHAADERIQLEELRRKVLSGEMKKIIYLDAEQELVLPEIGYQLLHNYAEQVQSWGWICNINVQDSRSFKKNLELLHRQPASVTLLAVPCILGVNLTDMDLLEFIQQLADTDGSSTMPPSVLRVLNFKACRGAIMFGDSLLPTECSLIVEELKKTSLCFQCAHGRPTTVPLVSLDALHSRVSKVIIGSGDPDGSWHGLRRREISLERATGRLSAAGD